MTPSGIWPIIPKSPLLTSNGGDGLEYAPVREVESMLKRMTKKRPIHGPLALVALVLVLVPGAAWAQGELTYEQYQELARASYRMNHLTVFEPLQGESGMYFALGERFGTVQVVKVDGRGGQRVWRSNQLDGAPVEVITADLSGDGLEDSLICRTMNAKIYVWALDGFDLIWESLQGEYQEISCFTTANMDDDAAGEIVLLADQKIVYIDGENHTKEFTGINEYQATMMRCGDVDADGRMEIVLNSGQVLSGSTADVEWEDEVFFGRIELMDVDADGVLEVLTEEVVGGAMKVFDVDYRSEVRFQ